MPGTIRNYEETTFTKWIAHHGMDCPPWDLDKKNGLLSTYLLYHVVNEHADLFANKASIGDGSRIIWHGRSWAPTDYHHISRALKESIREVGQITPKSKASFQFETEDF